MLGKIFESYENMSAQEQRQFITLLVTGWRNDDDVEDFYAQYIEYRQGKLEEWANRAYDRALMYREYSEEAPDEANRLEYQKLYKEMSELSDALAIMRDKVSERTIINWDEIINKIDSFKRPDWN